MTFLVNSILLIVGFLSFLPVVNLFKLTKNNKYKCLKYLMNTTFLWTILIFLERLSEHNVMIYYAHILGYPLKFLLATFLLCTIYNYIEKKLPKPIYYLLGGLFILELALALTNLQTQWLLLLSSDNVTTYKNLYEAAKGPVYMYHLVLTYLVVLSAVVFLVTFLSKHQETRQYKMVTRTMVYSSIIVLLFNISQLFLQDLSVDLTYVSLVIVTYALYRVIYHKDMIFNLVTSGRGEILSNMREMYIIADGEKHIVEVSKLLQKEFDINSEDYLGKPVNTLIEALSSHIVFYEHYDIDQDNQPDKLHFHIREKKFTLKGINDHGYMILLYDETKVFSLLRELNKLSNYDNMTGLRNRNYIENYIKDIDHKENIGVISLDLNGLKANNDYLGHERGDFLLKKLALIMKEITTDIENKTLARIGGDEFVIIIENTSIDVINTIKQNITNKCDSPNILDKVSVSIGVAMKEEKNQTIFDLLKVADEDMYRMKSKTSRSYSQEIVKYVTNKDDYIR